MLYLELIILGLPIAGLFAMLAVGIVSIYRATRVLNLAHGAMAMFSAYILYWLTNDPSGPGLPVGVGAALTLAAAAGMGAAFERLLLRPLRGRPVLHAVIMTVGALAALTGLAGYLWGYDRQNAPSVLPTGGTVSILGAQIGVDRIGIIAIAAALVVAVLVLFRRSILGTSMRAVADNREAAMLLGVSSDRVSMVAWMMGSTLAGAAGILLSPLVGLQPVNLTLLAIPAYAAALFGGLSSLPLTLAGAGLVGVAFSVVPALPFVRTSGFPGARELVIFVAVLVFLYTRWEHLFGSSLEEEAVT